MQERQADDDPYCHILLTQIGLGFTAMMYVLSGNSFYAFVLPSCYVSNALKPQTQPLNKEPHSWFSTDLIY